jgi:ribonuclease BN (tRNA processing enzyme)
MSLKIKVIGCGSAFSDKLYNSSFLLTNSEGHTLLIDCGYNIPQALKYHNTKLPDNIYVSHLHSDHIGGLERIAFQSYDWINKPLNGFEKQIKLFGNEQLIEDIWEKSLRGGLESMEGFQAKLNTYFQVNKIKPNDSFKFGNNICTPIQQVHIMSGNIIVPSFGLMVTTESGKKIYFVTDSQYDSPKQNKLYYNQADFIFQDCECHVIPSTKEIIFSSGVHSNYGELAGWKSANATCLSLEIKKKMWLCHYQDYITENKDLNQNNVNWMQQAKKDGFAGFVELGQEFKIN